MRTIQKTLFYMSSFIPLYLLLIVQNFKFRNESGKFSWQTIFDQINFSNKIITLFWIGLIVMIILSLFGCVIF